MENRAKIKLKCGGLRSKKTVHNNFMSICFICGGVLIYWQRGVACWHFTPAGRLTE